MQNMTIINLTQHEATPEQVAAGVVDLAETDRRELSDLLTFAALPTPEEIQRRAELIAEYGYHSAIVLAGSAANAVRCQYMIGGAPFLMGALERALLAMDCQPVYAFSRRTSVDVPHPDGSAHKRSVFRHAGFVEVSQ